MKTFSAEVPDHPQVQGESIPRRHVSAKDSVLAVPERGNIQTCYDVLQFSAKEYPENPVFGTRAVEDVIEEQKEVVKHVNGEEVRETKKWQYFKLSGYKWMSYSEAAEAAKHLGAGLKQLGLTAGDKVAVFAHTS
jgi:long-chain acyl-CoA synthetase